MGACPCSVKHEMCIRDSPSSNPTERVLREMGRILRTYCNDNQKEWQKYLTSTEVLMNISYHHFIENTPYLMMFGRKPHREIQ